jgi:hypothetical protein
LESPDRTPLNDPTFVAKVLSELPASMTQKGGTGWKGMGTVLDILDLVGEDVINISGLAISPTQSQGTGQS